ncbi:MAG TPA: HEXXH motif-containing putative peptide modification protein [Pyrinomonadaceae bacterium]|nr:HEXXH motif-containing putative peptide modification protein [Pyrinomonadaceae bacterium]
MLSTFADLPLEGKQRFITAPETFYRIRRLRREPVDSIVSLCNFLNGEAAFHGVGSIDKDYVTALGDYYYSELTDGHSMANNGNEDKAIFAPRVAGIPIDFASPNVANAHETDEVKVYLEFSADERALICENLKEVLRRIKRVSEAAAQLIIQHIKVIIPLKAASAESGSTSQPRFPGRVLLRGVEHGYFGWLAASLIHEAMHQVLYILEWAGPFTVGESEVKAQKVKSEWTGRDLAPHSYIHACFIWYGVSTFWMRARECDAFKADVCERELEKSMAGFRGENPIDRLAPIAGMVRYDVMRTAATLYERLQSGSPQTPISTVSSSQV